MKEEIQNMETIRRDFNLPQIDRGVAIMAQQMLLCENKEEREAVFYALQELQDLLDEIRTS